MGLLLYSLSPRERKTPVGFEAAALLSSRSRSQGRARRRQVCYVVPHSVYVEYECDALEDVFFCRDLYQPRTGRFVPYEAELRRSANMSSTLDAIRV